MFSRCAHWAYGENIFGTFWTTILNVMSDNMWGKWQSNISNVPRMYLVVSHTEVAIVDICIEQVE